MTQHIKVCVLTRHTIREIMVDIQNSIRLSLIYENIQKRNKINECSIICNHIWYIDISVCVYSLHSQLILFYVCLCFRPTQTISLKDQNRTSLGL